MNKSHGHRFIGRADELRILRKGARAAARETPRVVIASGPAGVGKTTLVGHFADAVAKEFTVLRAWDIPPKMELPFYTVTGLLDDGIALNPTGLAREVTGPASSVLSVGGAVIDLLDALQEAAPVLLWLDDAHKFDLESLQALGFALLRQGAERILTVISTQHPARTVRDMGLANLVPEPDHIVLRGFTLPETRDFIEDRTARPHSETKLRSLARWSDGNPLFLEAALGAFAGSLPDDPSTIRVPSSLSEAVGAWSRSFPPAGLAILNMLAVLDAPATIPLLGRLLDSDSVGADAEALVDQHAAVWAPDGVPAALRLVHVGQRDALYTAIPQPERKRMHLRVAEVLEPPVSWRHQVAAAETYDPLLAEELRGAAWREAQAGHAALAAEYLLVSSEIEPDGERRQDALVSAIRLQVTGGQHRTSLRHEDTILNSSAGPQRDEALGLLSLAKGKDGAACAYLRRALDAFAARGELDQAACAAAGLGLGEGSLGQGQQSVSTSEFALRHASDETVRGMAQANLAYGHALLGGPALGLRHVDHLPADPDLVPTAGTDALIYRGMFRGLAGNLTGGVADLTTAARRRDMGVWRISSIAALSHAILFQFFLGEWHAARCNLSIGLDITHTAGHPADFFVLKCLNAVLDAFGGRPDEAQASLREAVAMEATADFPGPDFHLASFEAVVAFAAGDYEQVVALIGTAVDKPVNVSRSRLYAIRHMPFLGVACARTGDTDRARSILHGMEAAESHGALLPVVVQWLKGAIAAADGDPAAAARAYENGLAVPPAGGDPALHRAFVQEDLGTVMMENGNLDQARRHLSSAEEAFTRLGAEPSRRRCRTLLAGADASAQFTAGASLWDTLSDRERDVAGLVARGWTNPEIAARLYLSVKTVEYHLGNIYAKNGIHGRRQLRDLMQSQPM
ncbi:AAA family ATPase [Streptomyces sp. CA-250714]|uniref:AAA family ATPase n=1 Tax=Streptomyces sp. CA-250714 TaxID=3240060 RepID=UPI003D8E9204